MKRLLFFAILWIFMLCLAAPPAFAQTDTPIDGDQNVVDSATLPDLKTDAKLKQISWDLDRLFDDALDQLPDFLADLPNSVKRVSVIRIDGDEHIYVNTVSLKYKLENALINSGKLQVVECRQCNNMKVYVEDESLILSRTVESNEQIAKLGKELKIDAYIQGVVTINEAVGKIQLGLQLVDIKDGTILKTASLNSFFLKKEEGTATQINGAEADGNNLKEISSLDLEVLFANLLAQVPLLMGDLPAGINRVTLSDFQEDDTYYVNGKRLQLLFENTLVNQTGLKVIECPVCSVQQTYAEKDAAVFADSAATSRRMQKLGQQLGFDAYIKSDLKIHEAEKKIEFNFKVVSAKDNSIVKAVSLKTRDEDRKLESDSEHSITYLPFVSMTLEGDAYYNSSTNTAKKGKIESLFGIQYRFVTTTIIENLLIGFDLEYFNENEGQESNNMHASMFLANFITKYRLPFKFGDHRLFNVAFGYGTGNLQAKVDKYEKSVVIKSMKFEGDALITPSFSIGLAIYALGSYDVNYEVDNVGTTVTHKFNGNGGGLILRYTF